ncbi:MAG: replication restart helicase PriA [Phycisphaerales bacterium]
MSPPRNPAILTTMNGLFPDTSPPGRRASALRRYAQVALEQALETPHGLTYAIPPAPSDLADLQPGDRVLVPLGRSNRTVTGYILSISATPPPDFDPDKIKPVAARDRNPLNLPAPLIDLAKWISAYYCCPLGMVFASLLPAAVKRGTGLVHRILINLAEPIAPDALDSIIEHHRLPDKQAAVLRKAVDLAAADLLPIAAKELADDAGLRSVSSVNQLVARGLLKRIEHTHLLARDANLDPEADQSHTLTSDQRRVLDDITGSVSPAPGVTGTPGFHVHLIHGVTGSGKTELYIQLIHQCVASGKSAVVLVPEIALTPQTVARFAGRFPKVAVLHSGLTAAQRHQQWQLIREGWADVIVGARSAVFAPTENLGLIVVDEEHDPSYKQDQAPRYHARDVAIKRAQQQNIPIILGSATPSLESYYNAAGGGVRDSGLGTREEASPSPQPLIPSPSLSPQPPAPSPSSRSHYTLHRLPVRVAGLAMPHVQIVNLLDERRKRYEMTGRIRTSGGGIHLLSIALEAALRQTLRDGGQAIILLNRRGFANYIACPDQHCGWQLKCEHCDVPMVYHLDARVPAGGLVRCHYCSYENRLPQLCPACGKKTVVFGLGTQRVEDEIAKKLPTARLVRMDSDAMRTGQNYADTLRQFRRAQIDILVGTQMIAKGLDFPNVRLVGVISADTALNLPDFRSSERTFQLVSQVAGRTGRGESAGRVIVQTFTPDHPSIQFAAMHDYEGFAAYELEHRRRAMLPPITRMARIVLRDRELEPVLRAAEQANAALVRLNDELNLNVLILGPVAPPIARIAGFHRMQIELIASSAPLLQRLLAAARDAGEIRSDANMAIDVDPVVMM